MSLNGKNLELCLVQNKDEKSKSVNYLLPHPVTQSLNKYLSIRMACLIFFSTSALKKILALRIDRYLLSKWLTGVLVKWWNLTKPSQPMTVIMHNLKCHYKEWIINNIQYYKFLLTKEHWTSVLWGSQKKECDKECGILLS